MTERDSNDPPEEDPTPEWLRAELDAPAPTDELTRERHLRAALGVFDDRTFDDRGSDDEVGARRRTRTTRWLGAAAAVVVALGVGGLVVANSETGSNSSADQVAGRESTDASSSTEELRAPGEVAPPTAAADAAQPGADGGTGDADGTRAAEAATAADLGSFATDAELRLAITSRSFDTSKAAPLPEDAPTAAGSVAACPAPQMVPGTSVSTYTATVDGVPVTAWVVTSEDGTAITVVDAATCTVRPG